MGDNRKRIPAPLTSGHLCRSCKGTGCDVEKTMQMASYDSGYVMCRECNGNGLDASAYFDWGRKRKRNQADRFKSKLESALHPSLVEKDSGHA